MPATAAVAKDLPDPFIDRDVLFGDNVLAVSRLGSEHQAGRTGEEQRDRERGGKCENTIEFHDGVPRLTDDYAANGR